MNRLFLTAPVPTDAGPAEVVPEERGVATFEPYGDARERAAIVVDIPRVPVVGHVEPLAGIGATKPAGVYLARVDETGPVWRDLGGEG